MSLKAESPRNTNRHSRSRPFVKRRLAALIAAGAFLHACSTLPEHTGESEVIDNRENVLGDQQVRRQSARQQTRNIGVPRQDLAVDVIDLALQPPADIWQRLNNGFSFALAHNNERVMDALDWYVNNPEYIQRVTERAQPFLYLIVDRIETRGLPTELALLPIVESAYNPNAVSRQNAVGLWQFMATTANGMGLTSDWWYDGRRDPLASTEAALDYLESLYDLFDNDWLLALAAYNMGQGNLQRAIRRNESNGDPVDFWSLGLPAETQRHVPRILALAHLFANAERYGIELDPIPNEPYLAIVNAGSQIDLTLVANMAGLEPEVIYRLNPGYRQWATHPDGPHTIMIPASHAETLSNGLATLSENQRVTWDRYVIQPGDTLSAIANRYRTRVNILQSVNNLSGSRIIAGDSLLIPRAYSDTDTLQVPDAPVYAATQADVVTAATYQVRSGDSLWRIATRNRMSVEELARWNNINPDAILRPGQTLRLQPASVAMQGASDSPAPGSRTIEYQVRPGDSLSRIARQFGVAINDIVSWNGIGRNELIHPGQLLVLHLRSR